MIHPTDANFVRPYHRSDDPPRGTQTLPERLSDAPTDGSPHYLQEPTQPLTEPLTQPHAQAENAWADPTISQLLRRQSYADHHCIKGAIVGESPDRRTMLVIPARCKRWDCPYCGPQKLGLWQHKLLAGRPERFITITCKPDSFPTPIHAAQALKRAWSRYVDHFRRTHHDCEYALTLQWHRNKWPHYHILQRGDYIPQRDLSAWMLHYANSPIVDVRAIRSAQGQTHYVTRYCLRDAAQADTTGCQAKRINTSRHYIPDDYAGPGPADYIDWTWSYRHDGPEAAVDMILAVHPDAVQEMDDSDSTRLTLPAENLEFNPPGSNRHDAPAHELAFLPGLRPPLTWTPRQPAS